MRYSGDKSDLATVAAIGALAFVLADVAHEVIGHGAGFLLAGGREGLLTTTRLIENERLGDRGGELFDLGGPAGNLALAGLGWIWLRFAPKRFEHFRLLSWLSMAFSLFWAFGYMIFCGVLAKGDWFALIPGRNFEWVGRAAFAAAGIWLYRRAIRSLTRETEWDRGIVVAAYWSGGVIACLGAALDPRGPMEMLNSGALSSFAAAAGLLWIPNAREPRTEIARSRGWIAVSACVCALYIFVLGPGIRF